MGDIEKAVVNEAVKLARKYGVQKGVDYIRERSKQGDDLNVKEILLNFKGEYTREDIKNGNRDL